MTTASLDEENLLPQLRQCYPDLTDEQLRVVQDSLVGLLLVFRRVAENEIQVDSPDDVRDIDNS